MITLLRRKKLGAGSVRGLTSYINGSSETSGSVIFNRGEEASIIRNDKLSTERGSDLVSTTSMLIRWGCTTETGVPLSNQLNTSQAIKQVNNKMQFRRRIMDANPLLSPRTVMQQTRGQFNTLAGQLVLRPSKHAQGRNLFVVNGLEGVLEVVNSRPNLFTEGWYASELIDKVAEYRVYVVSGKVATVARKTPDDPTQVAWNVAQGGRFDVVNWGDWNMEVCRVAIEAFNLSDLDFGGVDVMVDRDGRAYCIEINSAPSLPLLSDGSISYRQKCMAKTFMYIRDHGKDRLTVENYGGWRDVIHPAIQMEDYNHG